jgi:hypothetical protein
MWAAASFKQRKVPAVLMANIRFHSLPDTSRSEAVSPNTPAAFTRMSMRPAWLMTPAIACATSCSRLMSAVIDNAAGPHASAVRAARPPSRSTATTVAPAVANAVAMAAPMPAAAPVTTATRSVSGPGDAVVAVAVCVSVIGTSDHPFIAPAAIPRTNQRCIHRKKTTIGIMDSVT